MKSLPIILFCLLCIMGCGETKYIKPGATQADFEADKVACHNQILMSPAGQDIARAQMAQPGIRGAATQSASQRARRDVDECLRSKGWTPEP